MESNQQTSEGFHSSSSYKTNAQFRVQQIIQDMAASHFQYEVFSNAKPEPSGYRLNEEAEKYYSLLKENDEDLLKGCKNHSRL